MKKYNDFILEGVQSGDIAIPSGKLMGRPFFRVSHDTFSNGYQGKKKGKNWQSHLGKTIEGKAIQAYAKNQPKSHFFIQSDQTGEFVYARAAY